MAIASSGSSRIGGVSWMCWIYDPEWWPQMLKSWNYELTSGGEFLSKAMKGELDFQKK